jgi:UDPglucose 6-dehydrogenase
MLITGIESAEMIKYASNAFLATKISFINAIADLCERTGADIGLVAKGMGSDSRIGAAFLQAGLGFGGSCFPKDTLSLMETCRRFGEENELLRAVVKINDERVGAILSADRGQMGGVAGKTVSLLGLAFKPNTDDLREARSLEIINYMLDRGARSRPTTPWPCPALKRFMRIKAVKSAFCESAYDVAEGADVLIIVTEWNEFKLLDLERIKNSMKTPILFDGRNIYPPERLRALGFEYFSIGRGSFS